jgi:hypothetical protein
MVIREPMLTWLRPLTLLSLSSALFITGALVGCFEDPVGNDGSAETGGACEPGQLECECLPNLTCFGVFECIQGLCVNPTSSGDGDPTTGDGDGDPTTGDGDGDPSTGDGDGDGDPSTGDGDGDGDPTTGDGDGDGDPTTGDGDGDGDGDPTTGDGDGDGDLTTGDGDGDEPGSVCGDGNLDVGEACDGGPLNGIELGLCNPECSGIVTQKAIVVPNDKHQGSLGGIAGADAKCPAGYKAMIADGVNRVASVTPNLGDGQVDWVLKPFTYYRNGANQLVFFTDGAALLGVQNNQTVPLANAITATDEGFGVWTGMLQNWTSDVDCNNWTIGTMASSGRSANPTGVTNFINNGGASQCQWERRLYCVQQ